MLPNSERVDAMLDEQDRQAASDAERPLYLAAVIWKEEWPEFKLFGEPDSAVEWVAKTIRTPYSEYNIFDNYHFDPMAHGGDFYFYCDTYDKEVGGYVKLLNAPATHNERIPF
jgi:hypothetical protein